MGTVLDAQYQVVSKIDNNFCFTELYSGGRRQVMREIRKIHISALDNGKGSEKNKQEL